MKIESRRIAPNLFYIKGNSKEFLLSPLEAKVLSVDKFNLEKFENKEYLNKLTNFFKEIGIDIYKKINYDLTDEFKPVHAGLFLTSDCNLRCVYCYGNSGIEKKYLDFEPVKNAISLVFKNAFEKKTIARFTFHGGGEPTLNWNVLKRAVEYIKEVSNKSSIDFSTTISTNGYLNKMKAVWLADNINNIQLSFDGKKELQDKQRPHKKEVSSYAQIKKTIGIWNHMEKNFDVRATVTNFGIKTLENQIEFIYDLTKGKKIHVEPINCSFGRCLSYNGDLEIEEPEIFIESYIKTERKIGIGNLIYPINDVGFIKKIFCGAIGLNFCVTPESYITSCFGVTLSSDPLSKIFFYGHFDRDRKEFVVNNEKLLKLRSRIVDSIKTCQDCFALYNCGGGCLAQNLSEDINEKHFYENKTSNKCKINCELIFNSIEELLNKEKL